LFCVIGWIVHRLLIEIGSQIDGLQWFLSW
jgi:hypothetical protein